MRDFPPLDKVRPRPYHHTTCLSVPGSGPSRLRWDLTDWEALSPIVKSFKAPPPPRCPSPKVLDEWTTETLDRITGLLKDHTPISPLSHDSKPWWSPHLTILPPNTIKRQGWPANWAPLIQWSWLTFQDWDISRPLRSRKTSTGPPFFSLLHLRTSELRKGSHLAARVPVFRPSRGRKPLSR